MEHQRPGGDLRRDVRISVAVPAHPRAELEPAGGGLDRWVRFSQRPLDLILEERDGVPEGRVEIPETGPHLVHHLGPGRAGTIGQPEGGDLALKRAGVDDAGDLVLEERLLVMQTAGKSFQLGQHGASLRLGRMGGEDQFDAELVEEPLHHLGGDLPLLQLAQGGADRFAHRGAPFAGVLGAAPFAQEADAVGFLGEVDQLEVDREGHRHVAGIRHGKALDRLGQVGFRLDVAGPAFFREKAEFFLEGKDVVALEFDDDLAQHAAKAPNLAGKGVGVGIGW